MLIELRIKNFAIIDELTLSFTKGLNILTGETGAGKSIILNAVGLLLGDKATEEMIRSSEEEAIVEALFDLSDNPYAQEKVRERLQKVRARKEDDSLVVRRVISKSGRGKVMMNDQLATLGTLSEIGGELLSIYGQHEHQSLQRVETHIDILDELGGLIEKREEFQKKFQEFISLSEEVARIKEEKEKGSKERELMRFQLKEIEQSQIQEGEEEALREERKILLHAKKLIDFATSSEEKLIGENGSVIEKIQSILHQGREVSEIDPSLTPFLKNLETSLIQIEESSLSLRDYLRKIEINPQRLEEVENRLDEIQRLKRKYGSTVEEILLFKKRIEETLRSFTFDEERLSKLEEALTPLQMEVESLARRLSRERRRIASELKRSVEKELSSLGMKRTTFEVHLEEQSLSNKGIDRVEFLISPNIGEAVKPLAKIASGGELSRIMLAMKRILAKVGGCQVLIFDEVDSGIGGAIAEVVGRKLKELSKIHQVICVTHLPQIACFADLHHSVRKEVRGGRTVTVVNRLEKEEVVDEIARMLGGVKVTEKTRAHAREMIENAKKS
ncbi:MAG: DNA repair protein RecN [Thermodesulfobacteriota bacterium]